MMQFNFHIVIMDITCCNLVKVVLFWNDFMRSIEMCVYSARLMAMKIRLFLRNVYNKNNEYKFHM